MSKKSQKTARAAASAPLAVVVTPETEAPEAVAPETDAPPTHPDLRILVQVVRRRDRPYVLARLLVEEFARAEDEDVETAWRRHLRALEIAAAAGQSKSALRRTSIPKLAKQIRRRTASD